MIPAVVSQLNLWARHFEWIARGGWSMFWRLQRVYFDNHFYLSAITWGSCYCIIRTPQNRKISLVSSQGHVVMSFFQLISIQTKRDCLAIKFNFLVAQTQMDSLGWTMNKSVPKSGSGVLIQILLSKVDLRVPKWCLCDNWELVCDCKRKASLQRAKSQQSMSRESILPTHALFRRQLYHSDCNYVSRRFTSRVSHMVQLTFILVSVTAMALVWEFAFINTLRDSH